MFIFISNLPSSLFGLINIYIPLCLYLYIASKVFTSAIVKFTFHYVYIYMGLTYQDMAVLYRFTFHYVYIYMISRYFSTPDTTVNLHSTMFIFISLILVPIFIAPDSFTFHYVYIYIPPELLSTCTKQ